MHYLHVHVYLNYGSTVSTYKSFLNLVPNACVLLRRRIYYGKSLLSALGQLVLHLHTAASIALIEKCGHSTRVHSQGRKSLDMIMLDNGRSWKKLFVYNVLKILKPRGLWGP